MLVLIIGTLWAYTSAKRIPQWYKPADVSPAQYQELRDQFTETTRVLNNNIQRNQPFDFEITAQQINRWLNSLDAFDPQLPRRLPKAIQDPAIGFYQDRIWLGALLDLDGRKAVANLEISISLLAQTLVVDIVSFRAGTLALPRAVLVDKFQDFLQAQEPQLRKQLEDVLEGKPIPNRFGLPNSGHDFRIKSIKISSGKLTVRIEPLEQVDRR